MYVKEAGDDVKTVLKGVVRSEKIQDPSYYVEGILKQIEHKKLRELYGITSWEDCEDFLEKIARRMGKLRKGNVPDTNVAAKIVVSDW